MNTLFIITAINHQSAGPSYESTHKFIRSASAKTPTYTGAARMIANSHNQNRFDESEPTIKQSDISVSRIEVCALA
jgi:hypothetical protein